MEKLNETPNLLNRICFTDESCFTLNSHVNSQNYRYWSRYNQHLFNETHTQYRQNVNVWLGIIDTHLIGPFFITGSLNSEKYLELLQNNIVPAINNLNLEDVWYQHDGAPPHSSRAVINYLNQTFTNRWIGRGGPVQWPPRSPDMSPNDFSLWGLLKSKVYTHVKINDTE